VIVKLESEVAAILALPEVRQAFAAQGAEVTPMGAEAFGRYIKAELAKFGPVVKASGARID
jgi:tripartite-type tricarboxylate transporter receptor subunit TctC